MEEFLGEYSSYNKYYKKFLKKTETKISENIDLTYINYRPYLLKLMKNVSFLNQLNFISTIAAIRYMDIFISELSNNNICVNPYNYKIIACACLWLSEKYYEDSHLYLNDVIKLWNICNVKIHARNVLIAEKLILQTLNYDLNIPTVYHFIKNYNLNFKPIVEDVMDNIYLHIKYYPSEIAKSCMEIYIGIQPYSEVTNNILKTNIYYKFIPRKNYVKNKKRKYTASENIFNKTKKFFSIKR